MRAAIVGFLPLVVGLRALPAEAECAMPSPAMAIEATPLPPNPVLYRFELAYRGTTPLRIEDATGAAVPFTETDVSSVDGLRVRELHIAATAGTFTVSGEEYDAPRTYTIATTRPVYAAPVVEGVSWVQSSWTCSHEIGLVVETRGLGVVAFRVEWSGGVEAIVPPSDRYFWTRQMGGEIDPATLRAFLGHPNCVTDLVPTRMIDRRDFQLFARFADGTELEVALPRTTETETEAETETETETETGTGTGTGTGAQPQVAPWRIGVATATSIAALISVSTLLAARRRRRNAMIVP